MLRSIFVAALFVIVPACATAHEVSEKVNPQRGQNALCQALDGWLQVDAHQPDFVIFGEFHGTREGPTLVSELVCALARSGDRVLLAIEFDSYRNDALQDVWALPHETFAENLVEVGWAGRRDGVGSQAMFDLLVRAHRIKSAGGAIDVVAFNGARDDAQRERFAGLPGQGPHEAAQAENIAVAAQAENYDQVIVLVGNLHAGKLPVPRGDIAFDPMAVRLAEYGSVISLDMRDSGGSAWNCQLRSDFAPISGQRIPDDAVECGSHPSGSYGDLEKEPFIGLGEFPGEKRSPAFDGYFWVGEISASPPAVEE